MTLLERGDPAPSFSAARADGRPFGLNSLGGLHTILLFVGSLGAPRTQRLLARLAPHVPRLYAKTMFVAITSDPRDGARADVKPVPGGMGLLFDLDRSAARRYGAVGAGGRGFRPLAVVLDPRLRVFAVFALGDADERTADLVALVEALPPPAPAQPAQLQAPVLIVPDVFEPAFCRALIARYESDGGQPSGFMRDVAGKTTLIMDHGFKRRSDYLIEDESLREAARARIERRLVPEIRKAYNYHPTRIERYLVACYDAAEGGGHFRAHRDNTTRGTAHRRFAASINLNAEDYGGGDLRFPEFGSHHYRPPSGGAVVFSCTLLHEVMPVTQGHRFAFLPFLYDEAAARTREHNNAFLDETIRPYRSSAAE